MNTRLKRLRRWRMYRNALLVILLGITAICIAIGFQGDTNDFAGNLLAEITGVALSIMFAVVVVDRVMARRDKLTRYGLRKLIAARLRAQIRAEINALSKTYNELQKQMGFSQSVPPVLLNPNAYGLLYIDGSILVSGVPEKPVVDKPYPNLGDVFVPEMDRFEGAWAEILDRLIASHPDAPLIATANEVEDCRWRLRRILAETEENSSVDPEISHTAFKTFAELINRLCDLADAFYGKSDYLHDA